MNPRVPTDELNKAQPVTELAEPVTFLQAQLIEAQAYSQNDNVYMIPPESFAVVPNPNQAVAPSSAPGCFDALMASEF